MNQTHLEIICNDLKLGSPTEAPTSIYGSRGGSFMWKVNTDKASYAIKQLSPDIDITKQTVVAKYNLTEEIAYRFAKQKIPAVSAIKHSGKRLIIIENTGYLVYPWVEGYTLGRHEISKTHALKIAEVIAKLHNINMNVPKIAPHRFDMHTTDNIIKAIDKLASLKLPISKEIKEKQSFIIFANDLYLDAIPLLKEQSVVTHGDLNQLNILWDKDDQPILIDWESARKLNPTREIVRACVDWSGLGTDNFSLQTYTDMLNKYIKSGGTLNKSHINAGLYSGFGSMVNWMLYNIEIACKSDTPAKISTAIDELNGAVESMIKLEILLPNLVKDWD